MHRQTLNPTSYVTAPSRTLLSWQDAAAIIDACDSKGVPIPFALTFCTADEDAGTGGDIIQYEKAVRYVAGGRVRQGGDFSAEDVLIDRNPKTRWLRKIRAVSNVEVRNVHLHLILEINGKRVR